MQEHVHKAHCLHVLAIAVTLSHRNCVYVYVCYRVTAVLMVQVCVCVYKCVFIFLILLGCYGKDC